MNAKLWACIIAGVVIAHLSILFIVDHWRMLGKPVPRAIEPTFSTSTTTYTDAEGRTTKVLLEFTVPTGLANEKTLEALAAPPPDSASTAPAAEENR